MSFRIPIGRYIATDAEKNAVMGVMERGVLSPGPLCTEFERKFARFISGYSDVEGVLVNSGTDALRLALLALKERLLWPDDSEVIVPALTFVATANVVLQAGLKPVFVDVTDFDSDHPYCIDTAKVKAAITKKTCCILPVHLFGCQAAMHELAELVAWPKLVMVEDGCESLVKKHPASECSVYSFYVCHLLTMGVGGIAVFGKDPDHRIRSLANHGRDPRFLGTQVSDRPDYLSTRFSFIRSGYSCRATELQAAIGLEQLSMIDAKLATRKRNAQLLYDKLSIFSDRLDLVKPIKITAPHSWMMFPVVLKDSDIRRDDFCLFLEMLGIETRPLMPLLTQPYYMNTVGALEAEKHPVAKRASTQGFYVTCDEYLTNDDISYMADAFWTVFKNAKRAVQVA